jgi:hypothetical protein
VCNQIISYHFTDISASFFPDAKAKLYGHVERVLFSTLDCSKDPIGQGFEEGDYDLIVAANVLHATPNLNETVANVRKLLNP